jgi:predicted TIM-barrel fold metal-dependent hydrolase
MRTPWGEIAVSDAHVHLFSRRFLESLASQRGKTVGEAAALLGWDEPPEDAADLARRWVGELDAQGVARAALIASVPGDEASVIAAMAACPGRFFGYFMLDPLEENAGPRVRAALDNGLRAVCLFPAMHRYSVQDERVRPVFEEAARSPGRAVFVHCGVLTVGARKKLGLPSRFDMRFSNPADMHAIALRYPQLRFCVPHFGAGYFREALMLADQCSNVYLDTSSTNHWMRYEGLDLKTVFGRALDVLAPGRLLFGTDSSFFPRGWNRGVFEAQSEALLSLGIGAPAARSIFGGNLEAIFAPS